MISPVNIKESGALFDNHYQLKEKIGGGGFSEVWLAHDVVADFEVALKIYQSVDNLDETAKEDFRREFARLCSLNHSHIIHAVGFGIHEEGKKEKIELPYLAMNVCRNGSAKKLIGNITEDELWNFIEQIASGLSYLHNHGIVHQDMKPDNVLINSDGQYLIIDFGISTKTRNTLRKSVNGAGNVGGGTTWYMSAESFGTESPHIYARDIWAFGATLYELMTGETPFGEYGGLGQKQKDGKVPPIKQNYSEELKSLVYDCLALEAWNRPDADDILEKVKIHKGIINPIPPTPIWKKMVGVGIALLTIICGVLFWTKEEKDPDKPWRDFIEKKIIEANKIVSKERENPIIKERSEDSLHKAAKIYVESMDLVESESVKEYGRNLWKESQQVIDETYSYLDSMRAYYDGAESVARKYENRCLVLNEYISDDLRLKLKKQE